MRRLCAEIGLRNPSPCRIGWVRIALEISAQHILPWSDARPSVQPEIESLIIESDRSELASALARHSQAPRPLYNDGWGTQSSQPPCSGRRAMLRRSRRPRPGRRAHSRITPLTPPWGPKTPESPPPPSPMYVVSMMWVYEIRSHQPGLARRGRDGRLRETRPWFPCDSSLPLHHLTISSRGMSIFCPRQLLTNHAATIEESRAESLNLKRWNACLLVAGGGGG